MVHTASPVGRNPNNHEDMIRPAVDGVLAVMKACQKYKVKRVVITSSVAAVSHPARDDEVDEYDETCWSNPAACEFSAYIKSKTLAERAAWDFNSAAKKKSEFCVELVTICPSLIIGEMIGSGDSTSISLVRQVMMGEIPALP